MTGFNAFLRHVLDDLPFTAREGVLPRGGRWQLIGDGLLLFDPPASRAADVLLSAGVHGDETAPIEVCDALIRDIASGELQLATRVLFAFGNLAAMRAGKRYVDDDLNRLFRPQVAEAAKLNAKPRPDHSDGQRAGELEAAARRFFLQAPLLPPGAVRLHYDMHTAIRGSQIERFALYPYRADGAWDRNELAWLAGAGIEAVLLNDGPAGTFSYFTSAELRSHSFTLELGKVRPFGENDLSRFAGIDTGLRRLLAGDRQAQPAPAPLRVFRVVHVLTKRSDAFQMHVPDDVLNFTAYPAGTVITEDGSERYAVSHQEERIVFPNRNVKKGLRAGLMVVETALSG
ncbi:MAG: succinylglutamate desuccinylase [Myxococcales bacterium]